MSLEASGHSTGKRPRGSWSPVTVCKSNTRLEAVKKTSKAWSLSQEEYVTLDHSGAPWQWIP